MAPASSVHAETFRRVYLNNDAENARVQKEGHYADNRVVTSKYTVIRCDDCSGLAAWCYGDAC